MKSILPLNSLDALPDEWGRVAARLLQIEQTGEWKKEAKSFSAYITSLSTLSKKSRSVFWKLLVAGRTYNSLLTEFNRRAENFPALEDVRHSPSPASLELLEKICRVAPEHVVKDLRKKTLKAEIGRDYLLTIWTSYRPLLAGRTKRGRGATVPKIDTEDESLDIPLFEANALALLKQATPESLGLVADPYVYRIISTSSNRHIAPLGKYRPDIIILYAAKQSDPLTVHGVEVRGSYPLNRQTIDKILDATETPLDSFWIAAAKENVGEIARSLPKRVGVFEIDDAIHVIRSAGRIRREPNSPEVFLKSLLLAVVKSRQ